MDLELDSAPARGLTRYVRLVAEALQLGPHCSTVQCERPVCAYLALTDRLRQFPDRDVALTWDEEHGWAVAVESRSGLILTALRYHGRDVLPVPRAVATFTTRLFGGGWPGLPDPPTLRGTEDSDDLAERLAGYAKPELALPPR